jgi:cytoskeletal protein RodZ
MTTPEPPSTPSGPSASQRPADAEVEFGARLRAARRARGISVQQISQITKIPPATLDALEQGQFARLPGGLFTRAFLRSYAVEVGLDPGETVRDFIERCSQGEPAVEANAGSHMSVPRPGSGVAITAAVVVLAAVVAAIYLRGSPLLLPWHRLDVATAPAGEPRDAIPAEVATSSSDRPSPVGDRVLSASAEKVDPAAERSLPEAPDRLTLELTTMAECWLSVVVDGRPSFARLLAAGEQETRIARREIVLHVGDAGALRLRINGQPGRSLGERGEVVRARITMDNYRMLIEP